MNLLIFDSSTIINFAMNGILDVLKKLRSSFDGKFIMTNSVKFEVIDKPINIQRFELASLQIKDLLDKGIFETPETIGISEKVIKEKKQHILETINHSFVAKNNFMHIIDDGEASCIALSLLCSEKGMMNAIAVDERTTRILGEMPENLRKLFERKLHTKVDLKADLRFMNKIIFLRSSELVYVAWKKGLLDIKSQNMLDALLYATKFKGSSISTQEIEEIKRAG